MTRFLKLVDGSFIASSEIVWIEERGHAKSAIKTKGKKTYIAQGSTESIASIIEDETAQIVTAHPGYSVLFAEAPRRKNGEWKTFSLPVVAWRIMQSECEGGRILESAPVIAGVYDLWESEWALILPDGNVASPERELPMSVEKWLETVKKKVVYDDDEDDNVDDYDVDNGNGNDSGQNSDT